MDGRIELRGIVLNERPVGEYDKRSTILTLERGKITAFARGAKRPKNRLAAAMQRCISGLSGCMRAGMPIMSKKPRS